jgi:hypothetical protein
LFVPFSGDFNDTSLPVNVFQPDVQRFKKATSPGGDRLLYIMITWKGKEGDSIEKT